MTCFRADEGGGTLLTESAPASPNPSATLMNRAAFVLAGSALIFPADADWLLRGCACENCFVANDTFTTHAPTVTELLSATGSPSFCFPPGACPGPFGISLPPPLYLRHGFTNPSSSHVCVTAHRRFECQVASNAAMHVAAYLGLSTPVAPVPTIWAAPAGTARFPSPST